MQKSKFINSIRAHFAAQKIPDEAYFEMAAAEVERGNIRNGLWAKALSEALGDEKKAGALYIKLRVQAMREEAAAAIFNASQGEPVNNNYDSNTHSTYPEKMVIACPQCEQRLRVVAGKHLDITCPRCKNIFRTHT